MKVVSLGFVAVTAGTPVLLSAVLASLSLDPETRAVEVTFEPMLVNTMTSYAGLPGMVKGTGVNVLRQLAVQDTGKFDSYSICARFGNALRVADYAIDGDHTGDLVLVTYSVE